MSIEQSVFGKRYDVMGEIGKGGMGRIYEVHDKVKSQNLALKELSGQHADSPGAILRFKNEFRVMSQFKHPNIVKVHEFGLSPDNTPYITMELVQGKNLSALKDLSVEKVVNIMVQICQVLSYTHSRLYVHLDLKPDNIRLLDDGTIKLLDYGLMSQLGVQAPGKISGTYYYMAPEVIVGGIIDESTDLYALGVIGYELITGRRPFTGDKHRILQGHLRVRPSEPAEVVSDVPEPVNRIIMKLLEKKKDRRYHNCAEVLEDLRPLAGGAMIIETAEMKQGYLYSSKLVGRADEIDRFTKLLLDLPDKKSASLFIGAPAGMGKTRLLNEMKTLAELEGVRSLYLDGKMASDGVFGWLKGLFRQIMPLCGKELIEPRAEFISRLMGDEKSESARGLPSESEIGEVLAGWLSALTSDNPLVLFIDDMHWMDLKSVHVINELIRNKDKFSMILVGGFRNDEVDRTSPLWHTPEEQSSQYMVLSPLTARQTRSLVEQLLYPSEVSSEFSDFCFKNCGGNVFDLIEFLRYMITEAHLTKAKHFWAEPVNPGAIEFPTNLAQRLIQRTSKLNSDSRAMALAASVLGDDLDLESWQAVCMFEEDLFFQAIDELMANQIIIKTNGHYMFGHDKIRMALYESLDENQLKTHHEKTARFLESKLNEGRQGLVPTIARHFVTAMDEHKAILYSIRAAEEAERNQADWEAFGHYRNAVSFLEKSDSYPDRETLLLGIYEKASQFSSAAWIDAATCLRWLEKTIAHYAAKEDMEKVFGLSLSFVVTSSITGNYNAARGKIPEIITGCKVEEGTISWAILFGAGVCLLDWYQGFQGDCFDHAVKAIGIFEQHLDTIPDAAWPAYSWSLFWRDKARAYLGKPVNMKNVDKIRQLMLDGKSDKTIYWHTLTAVTARAALTGRWSDLMTWKQEASRLSREMGKIYWFECWISHSYLYGAIHFGEFAQLENHIERVQASPDPYQVRLAYLFRGMLDWAQKKYSEARESLEEFIRMEEKDGPDNSYLEGFVYLSQVLMATGNMEDARRQLEKGLGLANTGPYENPLYQLQYLRLMAELELAGGNFSTAEKYLAQASELADILDNPIQKGFIFKLMGKMSLQQDRLEDTLSNYKTAEKTFIALGNKYQAGKIAAIPELALAREKGRKKLEPEPATRLLSDTALEEKEALTVVADEIPEGKPEPSPNIPSDETIIDDDDLGKTR